MLKTSRLFLPRFPRRRAFGADYHIVGHLSDCTSKVFHYRGGERSFSQFRSSANARPIISLHASTEMTFSAAKRQHNSLYELFYWPGIPGRGEHIRLAFEEAGVPYKDVCNETKDGMNAMLGKISEENTGEGSNPPALAPPFLRHGDLILSQTPNILLYLGPQLGLVPLQEENPNGIYHVNSLTLTALDGFSNEAHDTHHPIATGAYYEEQKEEAKRKAADYIENRLPKFLGYFERVLKSEASKGGEWLYRGQLTYADLVLFQTIDGVQFAFPKAMSKMQKSKKYDSVFRLVDRVRSRENIKKYLASDRRRKYSMGIYRHYPELDAQ